MSVQLVFDMNLSLEWVTELALTHPTGPSVLQVRAQNMLPEHIGPIVIAALRRRSTCRTIRFAPALARPAASLRPIGPRF
jgi:hypothetical protein